MNGGGRPAAWRASEVGASTSAAATTIISRPVYPYPEQVAYTGTGDVDQTANYKAVTPKAADDHYTWASSFTAS